MARSRVLNYKVLVFVVLLLAAIVPNSEGRKLLRAEGAETRNTDNLSSFASLFLSALPRGNVPSSSPSKKGHATLDNEQLFARHLVSIDRILRSVPSPGVGH